MFETPRAATADFDETAEPTGVAQPSTVEPAVSVPLLASEDDRVLRIRAGQLSRLVALSGELVVESGQMHILAAAQQRMRVKQLQIADLLADLQQLIAAQPAAYALHSGIQAMRMQLNDLRVSSTDWSQQFEQHARRKEDLSMRLYREAKDSRTRPVADGLAVFPRLVRDIARRLGKQAALTVTGETHRIDRDILERIERPLNHLLRNALDHGLERPALRRERGKSEPGALAIDVRAIAGWLEITVTETGSYRRNSKR